MTGINGILYQTSKINEANADSLETSLRIERDNTARIQAQMKGALAQIQGELERERRNDASEILLTKALEDSKNEVEALESELSKLRSEWVSGRINTIVLKKLLASLDKTESDKLAEMASEIEKEVIDNYKPVLTRFGTRYRGEAQGGKRHGHGVFVGKNGDSLEGNWVSDSLCDGAAKVSYSDHVYEGNVADSSECGLGKVTWNDGSTGFATYIGGKRSGICKSILSNGDVYIGECKDGYRQGFGKIAYKDGSYYVGIFSRGKRHRGKHFTNSGELLFEGIYDDNEHIDEGNGTSWTSDCKNWSEGTFKHGYLVKGRKLINGEVVAEGVWIAPEMCSHSHRYQEGKFKEGWITLHFNGGIYTGTYEDGARSGPCTLTYEDGRIFKGEWGLKTGNRIAEGMMHFPDGKTKNAIVSENWEVTYPKFLGMF